MQKQHTALKQSRQWSATRRQLHPRPPLVAADHIREVWVLHHSDRVWEQIRATFAALPEVEVCRVVASRMLEQAEQADLVFTSARYVWMVRGVTGVDIPVVVVSDGRPLNWVRRAAATTVILRSLTMAKVRRAVRKVIETAPAERGT